MKHSRLFALLTATAALGVVLGGCASSATPDTTNPDDSSTSEFALPESIQESGVVEVGATFVYPPWMQPAGDGVEGVDVDFVTAVIERLGLEAKFTNTAPENMYPSVQNGRSDMIIGAQGLNRDDLDNTTYLSLYRTEFRLIVRDGNPGDVDPSDLCGETAGVTSGYSAQRFSEARSAECVEAGKEPIEILTFTDAGGQFLALSNGQSTYALQDALVARHVASGNEDLMVLEETVAGDEGNDNGWAFDASEDGRMLAHAFAQAISALAEEGTWVDLFEKYDYTGMEILPAWVNGEPVEN